MFTLHPTTRIVDPPAELTSTIVLPSRLDVHTVGGLAEDLERILRGRTNLLVIDADEVRHTDRAGLDFVGRMCRDLDSRGVPYVVNGVSLTVRIALELNGLQAELERLESRLAEPMAA